MVGADSLWSCYLRYEKDEIQTQVKGEKRRRLRRDCLKKIKEPTVEDRGRKKRKNNRGGMEEEWAARLPLYFFLFLGTLVLPLLYSPNFVIYNSILISACVLV